ncbi:hypothetical protein FQR65_LT20483 [Abscondita terminalis]|nr:hypothetical protein FQR65_LT20483 [Abscondita terminalis]
MTSARTSQTSGSSRSTIFFAALMVVAKPRISRLAENKRAWKQSRAIFFGCRTAMMQSRGWTYGNDRTAGVGRHAYRTGACLEPVNSARSSFDDRCSEQLASTASSQHTFFVCAAMNVWSGQIQQAFQAICYDATAHGQPRRPWRSMRNRLQLFSVLEVLLMRSAAGLFQGWSYPGSIHDIVLSKLENARTLDITAGHVPSAGRYGTGSDSGKPRYGQPAKPVR